MSWFHAPLLTPAQGALFLFVLIALLSDHYEELASASYPQEPPVVEAAVGLDAGISGFKRRSILSDRVLQ